MKGIVRFVAPIILALWGLALLPELRSGFRLVNRDDLPGVYMCLAMIPLLIPSALLAATNPRWGSMALATVGVLGVDGALLTPTFFRQPINVGLGPMMFLIAAADGIYLSRTFPLRVKRN
jgi:hypothetical protein